ERDGRAYWTACGAFAVLAIGARTSYAVFCAALAAAALLGGGLSALGRFLLGGVGPGLLLIAYWTWIVGTGRPAEFAIQTHLLDWHPHWKAIAGLLVSPARGLVFYGPAALFGAGGL